MAEGGGDSLSSFSNDILNIMDHEDLQGFFPDLQSIGNRSISTLGPYLEILEQPKQRGFRFRYPCEGPSHGGLPGENSQKGKKSFPAVQINNYTGPARIQVTLVTVTDPPSLHAHSLVGKCVNNGSCVVEIDAAQGMTAIFPNLGIQHVTKKKVKEVLMKRYIEQEKINAMTINNSKTKQTGDQMDCDAGTSNTRSFDNVLAQTVAEEERKNMGEIVDKQAKDMNLSAVRLCFQAYLPDENGRFTTCLAPVYSQQIFDSKAAAASELKICRMDRQAGVVTGGDEVFLLCDKVQKEDIEIRFFGNSGGKEWEDFAKFSTSDVHRQFAIVFKTPGYWNTSIEKPVTVQLELRRKTDGERSNAMDFIFKPTEFDPEQIGAKRRKKVPHFSDYSDQGGGGSGMGGAGGGGGPAGYPFLDPNTWPQFWAGYPSSSTGGFGAGGGPSESTAAPSGYGNPSGGSDGKHFVSVARGDQSSNAVISSGSGASSYSSAVSSGSGDSSSGTETHCGGPGTSGDQSSSGVVSSGNGDHSASKNSLKGTVSLERNSSSGRYGVRCESGTDSTFHDTPKNTVNRGQTTVSHDTPKNTVNRGQTTVSHDTPKNTVDRGQTICQRISKNENERFMQSVSRDFYQAAAKSLECFSQSSDSRYLLAAQSHQTTLPNDDGDSPLHVSIINGHSHIVSDILDIQSNNHDTMVINHFNKLHQTPLHLAVITKQPKVIEILLQAGADVTLQDRHGNTALHLASQLESPECLRKLVLSEQMNITTLERNEYPGVDLQNYDGFTAVHLAVMKNRLENLKILNSIGADMNAMDGKSGYSPLHHAVENNNLSLTGYFILSAKADINSTSIDGNTALHVASGLGLKSITALLVGAGADTDVVNNCDETPVDLATTSEVREVLEGKVGTSLISKTSSRMMDSLPISDQSEGYNDDLKMRISDKLNEWSFCISSDWEKLAKSLGLSHYSAVIALQRNPVKHLLDIYKTIDGSAQRLRSAIVDIGNEKAVQLFDKWFNDDSANPPKTSKVFLLKEFLETDSDYGSMLTTDYSLSSLPSLKDHKKAPYVIHGLLDETMEPY